MTTALMPIASDSALARERREDQLAQLLASVGRFTPDGSTCHGVHLQARATFYHYCEGVLQQGAIRIHMDQAAANWWTMVLQGRGDPRTLTRHDWVQAVGHLKDLILAALMPGILPVSGHVVVTSMNQTSARTQGEDTETWLAIGCEEGQVAVVLESAIDVAIPSHCR